MNRSGMELLLSLLLVLATCQAHLAHAETTPDAGADGAVDAGVTAAPDAGETPAPSPAPAPTLAPDGGADAAPSPTVKVTGYVEAFYQFNFNRPTNFVTAYRGFDDRSNSVTISNAAIDVTGTLGRASARLALQVGHTPASYYLAEPTYTAQAGTGVSDPTLWRIIQQAIAGYQVPVGNGLQLEAGIFLSPIGVEALAINASWNWSRSDLFFALPYYHAGARATYAFTDQLSGVVYVTNGWNDIVNKNPYPCFAGAVTYSIKDVLSLQALYFGGVEDAIDSPEGQPWRHLFDGTATWSLNRWLSVAAQADIGFEDNHFGRSYWYDGAAYVRVGLPMNFFIAGRVDYLHEHAATNSLGTASRLFFPADDVGSGTMTVEYRPIEGFSARLEGRADQASLPMYFKGAVQQAQGLDVPTAKTQQTLTLGLTAWF